MLCFKHPLSIWATFPTFAVPPNGKCLIFNGLIKYSFNISCIKAVVKDTSALVMNLSPSRHSQPWTDRRSSKVGATPTKQDFPQSPAETTQRNFCRTQRGFFGDPCCLNACRVSSHSTAQNFPRGKTQWCSTKSSFLRAALDSA